MENLRKKYEEEMCRFTDAAGARAFVLGRHALAVLLKALDVNPGDKIGVCAFTCLAVVEAVKVIGAIPIYLDIDEHLCIDSQEILIQDSGSLKAVILQHTFGNPGRLDELLAACNKIGAIIIEDCAHSLHCLWNNKKSGTFGQGAVRPGGVLTVNSAALLEKVDRLIEQFAKPASAKSDFIRACLDLIYHPFSQSRLDCFLGYNYSRLRHKLTAGEFTFLKGDFPAFPGFPQLAGELKARHALKQLHIWRKLHQIRLENTTMIEDALTKAGLSLWPRQPQADITMMRYPLRIYKKWQIVHRAGMRGLDVAGWYSSPVHPLGPNDLAKVNYKQGFCPHSESTIERLIHIPTGPSINKHKLQDTMKILNAV